MDTTTLLKFWFWQDSVVFSNFSLLKSWGDGYLLQHFVFSINHPTNFGCQTVHTFLLRYWGLVASFYLYFVRIKWIWSTYTFETRSILCAFVYLYVIFHIVYITSLLIWFSSGHHPYRIFDSLACPNIFVAVMWGWPHYSLVNTAGLFSTSGETLWCCLHYHIFYLDHRCLVP